MNSNPDSSSPQGRSADHDATRLKQPGVAYLISVVGTTSTQRWQRRMREIDLDPREGVVLRMVAAEPGRSQRSLALALQVQPSHLVAIIDGLEERGLLQRRPNPQDRRTHALHLTEPGHAKLAQLMAASRAHEDDLIEGLSPGERDALGALLVRLARQHSSAEGGHPGFDSDSPPGRAADADTS